MKSYADVQQEGSGIVKPAAPWRYIAGIERTQAPVVSPNITILPVTPAIGGSLCRLVLVALSLLGIPYEAVSQSLIYSVQNSNDMVDPGEHIFESGLDGNVAHVLVPDVEVNALVIEPSLDMLFFVDNVSDEIRSFNLDGSGTNTILSVAGDPTLAGLAVDTTNMRIYYTDFPAGEVRRVGLDGLNDEVVVDVDTTPNSVAVDPAAGLIFFTDTNDFTVSSADLDGNFVDVIATEPVPVGIALDPSNMHVYFSADGGIERVDYDGSNQTTIIPASMMSNVQTLFLDLANNHIYWGGGSDGVIGRADLDGSNVVSITPTVSPSHSVRAVALAPVSIVSIPAAGSWSLAVLIGLLMVAGGIYLCRRGFRVP